MTMLPRGSRAAHHRAQSQSQKSIVITDTASAARRAKRPATTSRARLPVILAKSSSWAAKAVMLVPSDPCVLTHNVPGKGAA